MLRVFEMKYRVPSQAPIANDNKKKHWLDFLRRLA
jgi:hypothetical protein